MGYWGEDDDASHCSGPCVQHIVVLMIVQPTVATRTVWGYYGEDIDASHCSDP